MTVRSLHLLGSPVLRQKAAPVARVVVEALDVQGQPFRVVAHGYKARAIQHEIDHLDGILFLDHLTGVKRALLLSKWKKSRKGEKGYTKEVTPEPAGEL